MGRPMADPKTPLLIKRYASRRLYNTETSYYVTLDDIAGFVRKGRDVQIIDLRTGDDLTRQYLLQIVADHESKGENVLPIEVLTDLVRSYATGIQSVVPQFLAASFDMLREGQTKLVENLHVLPNPLNPATSFEALRQQQEAFLKTMMVGMPAWGGAQAQKPETDVKSEAATQKAADPVTDDLAEIKKQLAELQVKLSKL